jgi:hypothetical protein
MGESNKSIISLFMVMTRESIIFLGYKSNKKTSRHFWRLFVIMGVLEKIVRRTITV